jgi:hypothetical protein
MDYLDTNFRHLGVCALVLVLGVTLSACGDFLDINDDPNNATPDDVATEPGLVFLTGVTSLSSTKTIEIIEQNSHAQTWSSGGTSVFIEPERYRISPFTTGNTWSTIYTDAAQNFEEVKQSMEEVDPEQVPFSPGNAFAQASIMQAYTYFFATVQWGEVPFSQANNAEEFPNPELDAQEDVLRGIISQINSAIDRIQPGEGAIEDRDAFYSANMENWERFGNTIKLRAYFLLDSGGADVASEINSLLDEPLIRDNAQNALFPFSDSEGNENNFFQLSQDFSGGTNVWYYCSDVLVGAMQDLGDPRLPTYCAPAAGGGFAGVPVGETGNFTESFVSDNIHRPEYPLRYATAAEVWLKEAEWEYRQGNTSAAQSALETGVERSMDFFDEKPGAISDTDKQDYIDSLPDLSSLSDAQAIDFIQIQQWLDLFERHPENWTHWRRTKTPDLGVPAQAALSKIIRRYDYPPDPKAANPNISAQQFTTDMWFEGN